MSVDTKRPKGRKARKGRKAPVTEYRCQFCGQASPVAEWTEHETGADQCPKCKRAYIEDDGCGMGWGN